MMKKKMISMVLILTMATGLMTGCGSNETGETGKKKQVQQIQLKIKL